jgi:hypothetical protein
VLLIQGLISITIPCHLDLECAILGGDRAEFVLAEFEPLPQIFNHPLQTRNSVPQSRVLGLDFAEQLLQPVYFIL